MNQPITMPALSDTMNNGRLVKWVKKIGDPIKKGESVADIETDKAVMEVETFHDGYLAGPLAAEGSEMAVGATIGYISDRPDVAAPAPTAAPASASTTAPIAIAQAPAPAPARFTAPTSEPTAERVRASPYARSMARQLGVDLGKIVSEGGAVHADAILDAARRSASTGLAAGPPYRLEPMSSVRKTVTRNMIAGLSTPTFRVTARLALAPLREVSKQAQISLTLLLARACALAIKAHPLFNAVYTGEGLALRERVDVAIAVDTPEGLIAPVIRDVAARSLPELAADWRAVHAKALSRRLSLGHYEGATFYLSNLGMFPVVDSFDAVLPLGAAAILCIAAPDGERSSFTLGCDHRVLAGADAARFLQTLAEFLADPHRLTELTRAA